MKWQHIILGFVLMPHLSLRPVRVIILASDEHPDIGHDEDVHPNMLLRANADVSDADVDPNGDDDGDTNKDNYGDADWHPPNSLVETYIDLTPDSPLLRRSENTGINDANQDSNQVSNQTANISFQQCSEYNSYLTSNGQCQLMATLPPVGASQNRCPDMFRCTDDISHWLEENQNRKEQLKELRETLSELQEELRNHRHRVKVLEMQGEERVSLNVTFDQRLRSLELRHAEANTLPHVHAALLHEMQVQLHNLSATVHLKGSSTGCRVNVIRSTPPLGIHDKMPPEVLDYRTGFCCEAGPSLLQRLYKAQILTLEQVVEVSHPHLDNAAGLASCVGARSVRVTWIDGSNSLRRERSLLAACGNGMVHLSDFKIVTVFKYGPFLYFCHSDCASLYHNGVRRSGVYTVVLFPGAMLPVYCDMETEGGGWTVFQRRKDGSLSFNRGWSEYRDGFGEPRGEHWLGNQYLHLLSNQGHYSLRIHLQDWSHAHKHALYHTFRVDDEEDHYRLHVSGFSGTVEDSFSWYHDQRVFSTPDTGNICAEISHAGWWFHQCFYANLNGVYYKGGRYSLKAQNLLGPDGIVWFSWKDSDFYSLKAVAMMIRPRNFRPHLSP